MQEFIDQAIADIRQEVGDKKAILALSGGVDSSVCAVLMHEAIGDHLTCVFVDHGLLRKGEREDVIEVFQKQFNIDLIVVDAADRFLDRLAGVADPEDKRKIIGEEFIRVFEEEQAKLSDDYAFLVQGTIASDVAESGGKDGKLVKSHHNVGGLPDDVNFDLIEPLKSLYKPQVRQVGDLLGLPKHIVYRQPFPGPGLGVRCLGEISRERLEILKEADAIFLEEVAAAGLDYEIWQYFAAIPDFKVVGMLDGERNFSYPIFLRAVTTEDATQAEAYPFEADLIKKIAQRITDEIPQVARVLYDLSDKPPATIEYE